MFRGASEVFRSPLNEFFSNVNKPSMPSMPNEMTLDQLYYWLDKYSGQEVPGKKPGKAYIKKEELNDIFWLTSAKDELEELAEKHGGKVKLRDVAEVFKKNAIQVNEVIYYKVAFFALIASNLASNSFSSFSIAFLASFFSSSIFSSIVLSINP